jgi:CRISPR-associated protein Cas1
MSEERLKSIVISGFGVKLRKEGQLIGVTDKEGEKRFISPYRLEQVIITGEVSITSGALRLLIEKGVDVVLIGKYPPLFARLVRSDQLCSLWREQITMSEAKKLEIGKEILSTALYNKGRILQSIEKNRNDVEFKEEFRLLKEARDKMEYASSLAELMGLEGSGSRVYFSALRMIIPAEWGFNGRKKRPPKDPINALLSYGYTILHHRVENALMLAGLTPFVGIIHSTYRNRPALSFDLTEEFRQVIVDRVVLTEMIRSKLKKTEFESDELSGGCFMSESRKKAFLHALYSRFEDRHTYGDEQIPFGEIIFMQAKKLAKAVTDEERYTGFKYR